MTLVTSGARRRVMIAHPFPLVVEALAALIDAAGYAVTRCANSAAACTATDIPSQTLAVVSLAPSEIRLLRERRRAGGKTIMLFDELDTLRLFDAIDLGIDGVLVSTAAVETVRVCVDTVADGGQWLDPAATKLLLARTSRPPSPALTRRERDVAELVATGKRNRTIADTLGISEGTVKMHLHNVYAKLGLESRTQLAMDIRTRAA